MFPFQLTGWMHHGTGSSGKKKKEKIERSSVDAWDGLDKLIIVSSACIQFFLQRWFPWMLIQLSLHVFLEIIVMGTEKPYFLEF